MVTKTVRWKEALAMMVTLNSQAEREDPETSSEMINQPNGPKSMR